MTKAKPTLEEVTLEGKQLWKATLGKTKAYGETKEAALELLNKLTNA